MNINTIYRADYFVLLSKMMIFNKNNIYEENINNNATSYNRQ